MSTAAPPNQNSTQVKFLSDHRVAIFKARMSTTTIPEEEDHAAIPLPQTDDKDRARSRRTKMDREGGGLIFDLMDVQNFSIIMETVVTAELYQCIALSTIVFMQAELFRLSHPTQTNWER